MTIKIAVHYDPSYKDSFGFKWIEYINRNNGCLAIPVNMFDSDIMKVISDVDAVMWHYRHYIPCDKKLAGHILDAIEFDQKKIVFPNHNTRWHFDEKVSQYYLLESYKVPHVDTHIFWNYYEALNFIEQCNYPKIFKLSTGAGSANVVKLSNYNQAKEKLDLMFGNGIGSYSMNEFSIIKHKISLRKRIKNAINGFLNKEKTVIGNYDIQKNYFYIQEYLEENHFDIRIVVVDDKIMGFIRYNRDNDFRASGSGLIDYDISKIPEDALIIARDLSKKAGFQSMAYDFLMKNGEPVINELSYCFMNTALQKCKGYWDFNLKWHHENNIDIEEFQVIEILKELGIN